MYDFAFLNHNYTYINTYLSMHEMRVKINLHKICTHTIFKFCFNQSHFFYRIDFIPIFADKMYKLIHILTAFLPSGGPNTPFLLLSSLDMMMFCVCWAVVWAEKLMMLGLYFSLSSLFSKKS